MSNRWFDAWLQATIWWRVGTVLAANALVYVLLWQSWLHPIQQQQHRLAQQEQEQARRYQQQQHRLRTLPPLAELERQSEQLRTDISGQAGTPFALPTLLKVSGGVLEHWQPQDEGGELMLRLNWQQMMKLLDYLATLEPGITVSELTLQGQSPELHLLMTLHAQK